MIATEIMDLLRNMSLRSLRVWQRNRDVYFVTWKRRLVK